ncbi:hypothetical protein F5Y10DRAFT_286346, partial [Nemania abortiva]
VLLIVFLNDSAPNSLIDTLRRNLELRGTQASAMDAVRKRVLETLRGTEKDTGGVLGQRISRNHDPPSFVVHIELLWEDLILSVKGDMPDEDPWRFMSRVLTVTGEKDILQALPCEDYLRQTWPRTAPGMLNMLRKAVSDMTTSKTEFLFKSGLCVECSRYENCRGVVVTVKGTDFEIAEIAEQLAWLRATWNGVAFYEEQSKSSQELESTFRLNEPILIPSSGLRGRDRSDPPHEHSFIIHVKSEEMVRDPESNSSCWRKLLLGTTVVTGFKIPSRPRDTPGLEIHPRIAVDLVGADQVTLFDSRLLIKGFSRMLYPTKFDAESNVISWHLIDNGNEYISFADPRAEESDVAGLDYHSFETARHVVG